MSEWEKLKKFTQARIGLGRTGAALPTDALLRFQLAHAEARDAVWRAWDAPALAGALAARGEDRVIVHSRAGSREEFLRRPDLGRLLESESERWLAPREEEISFVISDGLSAKAIDTHFLPFWEIFAPQLRAAGFSPGPLVLAPFGRVALSDEVGFRQNAKLAVIFIGERPGLSSSDSLGIYLTYSPKPGNHDAQRNCLSNIRPPEGLSYEAAAAKLVYLIRESLRLGLSGVELKEEAGSLLPSTTS